MARGLVVPGGAPADDQLNDFMSPDPMAVYGGLNTPYGAMAGDNSRDAGSFGLEFLKLEWLKASGRYEVRFDNADNSLPGCTDAFGNEVPGCDDLLQFVTLNNLIWRITRDLSLLGKLNFVHTKNLTLDWRQGRLLEAGLGMALRPSHYDWVNILFKYAWLLEQRPMDLMLGTYDEAQSQVITISPMFETPFRLQIIEKFAVKHTVERLAYLPSAASNTMLWINRLNWHIYKRMFDLGGEFRLLNNDLAQDSEWGFLTDASFLPTKYVRLAVGWNFTRFSDNEYSRLDRDYSGFFMRLAGQY
jgi:hypothetical protein